MKPLFSFLLFTIIIFTGFTCGNKSIVKPPGDPIVNMNEAVAKANISCGSVNPDQTLQWLKDIIVKAEEDKKTKKYNGNYMGSIFLYPYKNRPVFFVRMILGSDGLFGYAFDCNGDRVIYNRNDSGILFYNAEKQGTLIYSSIP